MFFLSITTLSLYHSVFFGTLSRIEKKVEKALKKRNLFRFFRTIFYRYFLMDSDFFFAHNSEVFT